MREWSNTVRSGRGRDLESPLNLSGKMGKNGRGMRRDYHNEGKQGFHTLYFALKLIRQFGKH